MISKYPIFAVALVAIATVAVAAIELAALSLNQQDADAKGCTAGGTGFNASQGRCFKADLQANDAEESDEEEDYE